MRMSLNAAAMADYLERLLANYIPDGFRSTLATRPLLDMALARTEHCISRIHRKYFEEDGAPVFSHLNGDQFAAFLYYYANSVWRESGDEALPTRLFMLNKAMHGLDLYFSVSMPDVFRLVHPVGTVLGRADYGNYLVVYQNCAVGADEAGVYPQLGEGCVLYARSSVLGQCKVGNNVVFAANAFLLNSDVPDNSVVAGQYPQQRILPNQRSVSLRHFEAL